MPYHHPPIVKKHGSNDDKFVHKERVELVDLEVVVRSALEDERRFEMLSPEGRFVVTQELPKMPDPIFFVGTKKKNLGRCNFYLSGLR